MFDRKFDEAAEPRNRLPALLERKLLPAFEARKLEPALVAKKSEVAPVPRKLVLAEVYWNSELFAVWRNEAAAPVPNKLAVLTEKTRELELPEIVSMLPPEKYSCEPWALEVVPAVLLPVRAQFWRKLVLAEVY